MEKFERCCVGVTSSAAHVAAGLEAMPGSQVVDPSPQQFACVPLSIMIAVRDIADGDPELQPAADTAKVRVEFVRRGGGGSTASAKACGVLKGPAPWDCGRTAPGHAAVPDVVSRCRV